MDEPQGTGTAVVDPHDETELRASLDRLAALTPGEPGDAAAGTTTAAAAPAPRSRECLAGDHEACAHPACHDPFHADRFNAAGEFDCDEIDADEYTACLTCGCLGDSDDMFCSRCGSKLPSQPNGLAAEAVVAAAAPVACSCGGTCDTCSTVCACPSFAGATPEGACLICDQKLGPDRLAAASLLGFQAGAPVGVVSVLEGAANVMGGLQSSGSGNLGAGGTFQPTVVAAPAPTPGPIDPARPGRFRAILVTEEEATADGRIISKGATTWRTPPLPLMLMTKTDDGHDGAVVCGVIEKISRSGNQVIGEGRFDTSENGIEAARLVRDKVLTSVSVDGGAVEAEVEVTETADGESLMLRYTAMTLLGATIVPFPAIGSAEISYLTAAGAPASKFVAGTIEWGPAGEDDDDTPIVFDGAPSLTAAGPIAYPREYFTDPHLVNPTLATVMPPDENGVYRVHGHLAQWGQCHRSFQSECVLAPRSRMDYREFLQGGPLFCDDGSYINIGVITMGTGHADGRLDAKSAQRHYDDTGVQAAYVMVGEDQHGIWFAGVLAAGLTAEQATAFQAASLSGDWRYVGGGLEMVGCLAVNTPGYAIGYFRDEQQISLVAAGYGPDDVKREHIGAQMAGIRSEVLARVERTEQAVEDIRDLVQSLAHSLAPVAAERLRARMGLDLVDAGAVAGE